MVNRYRRRTNFKTRKRKGRKNTRRMKSRRKIKRGGAKYPGLLGKMIEKHEKKKINRLGNMLSGMNFAGKKGAKFKPDPDKMKALTDLANLKISE